MVSHERSFSIPLVKVSPSNVLPHMISLSATNEAGGYVRTYIKLGNIVLEWTDISIIALICSTK